MAASALVGPAAQAESSGPPTSPPDATPAATSDGWVRRPLGEGSVDGGVASGVIDGNPVVVHGGEGRLVSWVSTGGEFVATDSPVDTSAPVWVFDLAQFEDSAILVGSDSERFVPRVWTSTDGAAWTEVETTGLDQPADVLVVRAAPDALYAAGLLREGPDPAVGTFVPAIWRSTDARHWEAVTPPRPVDNGHVSALSVGADSMAVAVNVDAAGSIWRSTDRGETWTRAAVDVGSQAAVWQIGSIARLGDRLVGGGVRYDDTDGAPLVVVSTDDGATWSSSRSPLAGEGGEGGGDVVTAAGAFWISAAEFSNGFSNPDACYRDLQVCQTGARPVLLRSTDGVEWADIDLAPLSLSTIERVVDVADHGVMVVGRVAMSPRTETWTWSGDGEPPRRPPPEEGPLSDMPPLVGNGDRLAVGATYRFPLYVHCGMGLLGEFNGRWWMLVAGSTEWDPAVDPSATAPAHWPIAQEFIYGTITLVDADTIEYRIPSGEVIAVYEASTAQPQGCA